MSKTIHAKEISNALKELARDLRLGALDSEGYANRAARVASEACAILEQRASRFTVELSGAFIEIPVVRFGPTVTSLNLFDYKELSVFAIYLRNSFMLRRFLDLGSNIGSHSLFVAKLGAQVRSWDPDESVSAIHRQMFSEHGLHANHVVAAAGALQRKSSFLRLEDNQTGSHLEGMKPSPYGPVTRIEVSVEDCRADIAWADFVKMDVEGVESEIICELSHDVLARIILVCEITNYDSSKKVYGYLQRAPVSMFCQKRGWLTPRSIEEMPTHHSHGSLVIIGHQSPATASFLEVVNSAVTQ
jgi:FkbM family methyltransferase